MQSIITLIEQQVDASAQAGKSIDKIILVGGFGGSRYLLDTLKIWCERHGSIQVFCPDHPQAAIAMGAAIRGLGGGGSRPKTRKCRRYYGFQLDRAFDELRDDKRHMYSNEYDNKRYVRGTMAWKVSKVSRTSDAASFLVVTKVFRDPRSAKERSSHSTSGNLGTVESRLSLP